MNLTTLNFYFKCTNSPHTWLGLRGADYILKKGKNLTFKMLLTSLFMTVSKYLFSLSPVFLT